MSVINFPKIESKQIALLLCENATGNVLKSNGKDLYLSEDNSPYIIENSIIEAKNKAHQLVQSNPNLEILLYDHKGFFLEIINTVRS